MQREHVVVCLREAHPAMGTRNQSLIGVRTADALRAARAWLEEHPDDGAIVAGVELLSEMVDALDSPDVVSA